MKIGILTFHCAANYGAVLQAYGLQSYLRSLGHDVHVIDYRPEYLLKPYRVFRMPVRNCNLVTKLKLAIRALLVAPVRWRRNVLFDRFRKRYLNVASFDLDSPNNDFDAFVFGSDQIWNPRITWGFDRVYFGDFPAAMGKKKIAYAASAGSTANISNKEEFLSLLANFQKISVRETELAGYIKENMKMDVPVLCDPVLLGGRSLYAGLAELPKVKKPYLLLFQLSRKKAVVKYAENLAKKSDMEFIELAPVFESLKNCRMKQTFSLEQFIGYIVNAEYVLTSSFHGTVFSVLFRKNFNVISVDRDNDKRAVSLLERLGLGDRIACIEDNPCISEVDYAGVDGRMEELLKESAEYISSAL